MGPLILVVDDNPDILFNIKLILESHDYRIITAESGETAIKELNNLDTLPELIISDINMPNMNGYDFFKKVSDTLPWSHIPFIFLSALATPEDVRFGKLLGVDDYITKPFKEEDLLAVMGGKIARNKKLQKYNERVNEILSLEIKSKHAKEKRDLVLLLVIWDDIYGPKVVSYCPKNKKLSYPIDKLGVQLYNSASAIYGDEDFSKAGGILLNIANFDQDGYIFFDAKEDSSFRSGEKQFMLGLIAKQISYYESLHIKQKFIEISKNIKKNEDWDLEKYCDSISNMFSKKVMK